MKKIVISPHDVFPPTDGGQRRIYLLLKEYSRNEEVVLVCPKIKNPDKMNLRIKVIEAFENNPKNKILNFKLIKILKKLNGNFQLEFPWQAINLIVLNKRYILDEHNVEFLRFKRLNNIIWPFVYILELITCKLAKRIICVSEKDKEYLAHYFKIPLEKINVVENPIDNRIFKPNPKVKEKIRKQMEVKKDEKLILFNGQLNYAPNIEALKIIKKEILPKLDNRKIKYKLIICGKGNGRGFMNDFKHKNLKFMGFVDKIEDYINAADVVIAPLVSGSGTRIKILEALACGIKVVSTKIGAEGIKANKLLVIEDDWEKFVEKI